MRSLDLGADNSILDGRQLSKKKEKKKEKLFLTFTRKDRFGLGQTAICLSAGGSRA